MRLCLRILLRTSPEEIVNRIRHQCRLSVDSASAQLFTLFGVTTATHDSRGGGYATVYSLVAHEDKFVNESQKRTLEKVVILSSS